MFKIGVCGFGTVGKNLVSHFLKYQDLISNNCNEKITISVIADRSIERKSSTMTTFSSHLIFSA